VCPGHIRDRKKSKRAQRVAQQQLFKVDDKEVDVSSPAVEVGLDGAIE